MQHSIILLNDGETFSGLGGCQLIVLTHEDLGYPYDRTTFGVHVSVGCLRISPSKRSVSARVRVVL